MMLVSSHRRAIRSPQQQEEPFSLREPVELLAEARLQQSSHVSRCRISCVFYEGVLILRGRVPSYYAKQMAQTVVRYLDGVLRIDNQLDVVPKANAASDAHEETRESTFPAAWRRENSNF